MRNHENEYWEAQAHINELYTNPPMGAGDRFFVVLYGVIAVIFGIVIGLAICY